LLEVAASTCAARHFQKDAETAGIQLLTPEGKATWHSLRKWYVTAVIQSGADLKTAMELARHSSASLTMETYAAKDERRLRDTVERVSPMIPTTNTKPAVLTDKRVHGMGDTGLEPARQACRRFDTSFQDWFEAEIISRFVLGKAPRVDPDQDAPSTIEDVPRVTQLDIDPAAQMWLMADRFRGVKP
jgi:hypothetical protein